MVSAPPGQTAFDAVLAVVVQVRDGHLEALPWRRARAVR
jgi:hypothetical protein